MIETSARLLQFGPRLHLTVRRMVVRVLNPVPEILQKACNQLQSRHGVAAVPYGKLNGEPTLLVLSRGLMATLNLTGKDWTCTVSDVGQLRLEFGEPLHRPLMAELVERSLLIRANNCKDLWNLDSPRFFQENLPFQVHDGIAAYRRYRLSVEAVEGSGLVVNVEPATMFLSEMTVADFFDPSLSSEEAAARKGRFERLSQRQALQKGTLVYDSGNGYQKAYFEQFKPEWTCGSAPAFVVDGERYESLLQYYQRRRPGLKVRAEDTVAMVRFEGIKHPVPVAARLLRVRIFNDSLPDRLSRIDKLSPEERVKSETRFWQLLGSQPLGKMLPELGDLWRPSPAQFELLPPPALIFGSDEALEAPKVGDMDSYTSYYKQRLSLLNQYGCYFVPSDLDQVLYVAALKTLEDGLVKRLAMDGVSHLNRWTMRPIRPEIVPYVDIPNVVGQLRSRATRGTVLFVLDGGEPVDYYDVARELRGWRVKRVLSSTLKAKAGQDRDWQPFVSLSALDVLQEMGCVPWGLNSSLHYDVHLAIDVGHDGRHFVLSLLAPQKGWPFRFYTETYIKADPQRETIHPTILKDEIVKLFKRVGVGNFKAVGSVLVIRDGRECGEELRGISEAQDELRRLGFLKPDALVDVVDYRKRTASGIRVWENRDGHRQHAPEGIACYLDDQTAILVTTGAPTLPRQGTASPMLLKAHGPVDMRKVCHDLSALTYLNWSSTRMAQRHPPHLKEADEALTHRSQQEIRRHK